MARIAMDAKPDPGFTCPECNKPGRRGRCEDGKPSSICEKCLSAMRTAITRWKSKRIKEQELRDQF